MRKYGDACHWQILVPTLLDTATAAIEAKRRLRQMYNEATWRLNETEAEVLGYYFKNVWIKLIHNYGERRNMWQNSWGLPERQLATVHLGDTTRKSYLLPT
jgi:hypothetical protein